MSNKIYDYKPESDELSWLHRDDSLKLMVADLFNFLGKHMGKFEEIDQKYIAAEYYWINHRIKELGESLGR